MDNEDSYNYYKYEVEELINQNNSRANYKNLKSNFEALIILAKSS